MNGGVLPEYIGSRGEHHWRVYGSLVTFYFFKFLGQGRGRKATTSHFMTLGDINPDGYNDLTKHSVLKIWG